MSHISIFVGSSFAPAPIELTSGMLRSNAPFMRANFGDSVSLTLNTLADCVYLNVAFKHADALAFLNDVSKRYVEDIRKDKYEKAMEKLRLAQEEVSKLEKELEEECA